MPGIADGIVAPETAGMTGNDLAVRDNANLSGGAAQADGTTGKAGGNGIAVAVEADQTGAGGAQHLFGIAVKERADHPQGLLPVGKTIGNAPLFQGGMANFILEKPGASSRQRFASQPFRASKPAKRARGVNSHSLIILPGEFGPPGSRPGPFPS